MKKDFNSKEERIFAGFRRLSKILKTEEFGHHGQTRILNVLAKEGPMTQRNLQDEVEIKSASASELLKKMEDHGLVKRSRMGNADLRYILIYSNGDLRYNTDSGGAGYGNIF